MRVEDCTRICQTQIARETIEGQIARNLVCSFVLSCIYSCKFIRSWLLFRYCIPMDNDRPSLDLKHFGEICPDKNGTPMSKCSYGSRLTT